MRYLLAIICLACTFVSLSAQDLKQMRAYDRSGVKNYEKEDYRNAELDFRRALDINPSDTVALFDLATSLIQQKDPEKVQKADSILVGLMQDAGRIKDRKLASSIFYQAGEVAMMSQKYDAAVQRFKEALRYDPNDDDARYSYLLAKKQLQNQQNQDQNQDQDQQQQQQQDQQNQDQNQDQQDQQNQNQNQDQQNPNQQDPPQEQEQSQQPQMSEDQRQAILEQNEREEKETAARVQQRQQAMDEDKKKEQERRRQQGTLKDW